MRAIKNYLLGKRFLILLFLLVKSSSIFGLNPVKPKYKVLFPIPYTGGEGDMGVRLEIAARNIGWTAQSYFFRNEWHWKRKFDFYRISEPFKYESRNLLNICNVVQDFQPDFIVCLFPKLYTPKSFQIPHYLALTRSHTYNILHYGKMIRHFQGLLCVPQDHTYLYEFLQEKIDQYPMMDWVPTVLKTKYEPIAAKRLFYCGVNWDPLRTSPDYFRCVKLLDQTGLMDVYGTEGMKNWNLRSYKGELPYDGKSFPEALKKSGIVLVLHSQEHLDYGVITSRIFEAVASGCVVISDRHEFVEKEFGDTILYLDIDKEHKLTAEKMFEQIYAHLMWIFAHPREAEEKARKAHEIFDAKFTLEGQLERLGELHQKNFQNYFADETNQRKIKFN